MFKRIITLTIMLFGISFLTACTKYDISVQTAFGKDNANILRDLTKKFTKKTGLKVKYEESDWSKIKESTEKALSSGSFHHLVFAYNDHIASYNRKRANVKNLKEFIDNDKEFKKIYDKIPISFQQEGKYFEQSNKHLKDGIFNLPLAKSTDVLFYNKDLLAKLGYTDDALLREKITTWDGVYELCEQILSNPKFASLDLKNIYGYDSDENQIITDYEQRGFDYTKYNDEGKGEVIFKHEMKDIDSAEINRLLQLRKFFLKKYFITKGSNSNKYTSDLFKAGQTIFTIGSSGGVKYNVPLRAAFNVGVAPVPQFDVKNGKSIQQGPNIAMLDKGAEENAKAWKLMKFLLSDEVQLELSTRTGYSPVTDSVLTSKEYANFIETNKKGDVKTEDGLRKNLIAQVFEIYKNETSKYYTSPTFAKSTTARKEIGKAFTSIIKDKVVGSDGKEINNPTDLQTKEYIISILRKAFDQIEVA